MLPIVFWVVTAASCSHTVGELRERDILYATAARSPSGQQAITCVLRTLEDERSMWSSLSALHYRVLQLSETEWELLGAAGTTNRFTVTATESSGRVTLRLRMAPPTFAQEGPSRRP
jgi:hypothetical protein